jgi:hypothetical protein
MGARAGLRDRNAGDGWDGPSPAREIHPRTDEGVMTDRPKRETMSLEEATISNMWEIAAIVEVLEKKGFCTKQELLDAISELRNTAPRARIPETVFPSPYVLSETENKVIDDILAVLNQHGMDSKQSLELLEQIGRIIEMGARMARGTTH